MEADVPNLTQPSDEPVHEPHPRTIRAAADGDVAAFEELVHAYQVPMVRFLAHLLGDRTLAEDVAQEAFLRVYRNLHRFEHESRFSTWLFQIAHHAGIDAIRARDRRRRLERQAPRPSPPSDPQASVELNDAIGRLSVRHREAVLVVEVLGYPYREAAEVLGVPEGTLKRRVHEAREHLVDAIGRPTRARPPGGGASDTSATNASEGSDVG